MLRTHIVIVIAAFFFSAQAIAVDAAVQGFSDEFNNTPFRSVDTDAWAWAGMEGLLAITASIDIGLLDLIDQEAPLYFNSLWNLNIDQFKAWLATIVWAESGYGGYGAHSQYGGGYDGDAFNHIIVGQDFRFSSGIGPFQLDRYSSEAWHLWRTGEKIHPQMAVESGARWHQDNRGSGSTLNDFANNSPWIGVRPPDTGDYWRVVTGTDWSDHSSGIASLDWTAIKNQLAFNASTRPHLTYSNNIVDLGSLMWNIQSSENLQTDSGRPVIFDGSYPTLLITARRWLGTEVCVYYYTYRTDGTYPIEVWAWDNYWDTDNTYKYIFARECNGPFPEARSGSSAGYAALSAPAIDFPPRGDINGDGKIDLADFSILSSQWLQAPGFPSADIFPPEGDGAVNILDLNMIIQHWLESTIP